MKFEEGDILIMFPEHEEYYKKFRHTTTLPKTYKVLQHDTYDCGSRASFCLSTDWFYVNCKDFILKKNKTLKELILNAI